MDALDWQRVKEAFAAVVDLGAAEREEWLAAHLADAPDLAEEVRDLLAAHEQADFLEPGALAADPDLRRALETAAPGLEIGPYRVRSEIGRGGMGAVYLAERADAAFPQTVAVKLIKRGMDSAEIVRRFVHERRILAGLAHPNIARLLDGGSTGDGRPYFVMEHVEGVPITTFARDGKLSIEARLRLFLKVCAAVQYAHQNLIVHRDLKPANILVGPDGEPKLLDFGIAKLLDPDGAERTALTDLGQKPMTPDYASPEQLAGGPVTTATDVYALGILLYELLVGKAPHALRGRLGPGWTGKPPSQAAPLLAEDKGESRGLARRLRGDLDTIVGKALAPDPGKRYGTAAALAEDLERHLTRQPVRARRPTLAYRLGRALLRHKLAAALVLSLVAFAATTGYLAATLARQRDRGEVLRLRAEGLNGFLVDLFRIPDPDESRGARVTAREVLDVGARRLLAEGDEGGPLGAAAEARADLLQAMGDVYLNLGLYRDSQNVLGRSLELRSRATGRDAELAAAETLTSLGDVALEQGSLEESRRYFERARRMKVALLGPRALPVVDDLNGLGRLETEANHHGEAAHYLKEALDVARSANPRDARRLAETLSHLGNLAAEQGDLAGARVHLQEALAILRAAVGDDHPDTVTVRGDLGSVFYEAGDLPQAERIYREILETHRRILGPDHGDIALALSNLAVVQHKGGHLAEAEASLREALALRARLGLEPDGRAASSLNSLAAVLRDQGDLPGAEAAYEQTYAVLEKLYGESHPELGNVLIGLALVKQRRGDLAGAEHQARRALALSRKTYGPRHLEVGASWLLLGTVLLDARRPAEAEAAFRQALEIRREALGTGDSRLASPLVGLGRSLLDQKRAREAEPLLAEAVALRRQARPMDEAKLAEAEGLLSQSRAAPHRPR